jgi:hypothetical protein
LSDQVYNLLQDQIFLWDSKPDRECLRHKAAYVPVDTISAAGSDMGAHNPQSGIFCYIATSCPENIIQDHGEVYDVAHHASDILLAGKQAENEQLVGDTSRCSLTCLDIHRKPSQRACLQIHSSHYWQVNSLNTFAYV